jgi:uncharacterized protein (TIGR02265 family)
MTSPQPTQQPSARRHALRDAPQQKLVFGHVVEALFLKAIKGELSVGARYRLKEVGLDLDAPLLPAYPLDAWVGFLQVASQDLFRGETREQALFLLGQRLIDAYRESTLGRAVLTMARVLGPRRTLSRTTQNFRSGNNYSEAKLVDVSAGCVELHMNEVGPYPTFTQGILTAGIRYAGAKDLTVELREHDGHACVYVLRWKP